MENIKVINKIRIKRKEKQLLLRFVTGILIFSILLNVGIAALYPQVVYASFAGTVAGYILTLFASFNTAIANPNVVSAINNTFGSMALEAADAGVIDQGIAQIAQTTGFDMAQVFSNTAAEAEQVVASGWDAISTSAQTAGQNIEAGAAACAASAGAVLPAIGGAVLPAAGAVGAGVGLGILIDKVRNALSDYIRTQSKLDTPQTIMVNVGDFTSIAKYADPSERLYMTPDGVIPVWVSASDSQTGYMGYINYSGQTKRIARGKPQSLQYFNTSVDVGYMWNTNLWNTQKIDGFMEFQSAESANEYAQDLYNGNIPDPYATRTSPDVIGGIGNQTAIKDNGNYITPNITNIYDYGNTIINYIDPSDYQDFVDRANDNTDQGDTGEETQGEDFDTFVSPYIQPIQNQPQEPELPDPQPTIAPTNPTIPVQPTPAPEPTLTPEEEGEMPKGMTQPQLSDKFPFCIPFDIGYLFNKLTSEREAPHFVWTLDLGVWGQYEIEIDLSMFDSVAAIFRLCELILFIFGLMLITKSLMSSNDGG